MATADRSNRARMAVMALGIAMCSFALLAVATVNPLMNSVMTRVDASQPSMAGTGPEFHTHRISNSIDGEMVVGTLLAGPGDAAPPPGTSVFPAPGELLVSLALGAAMADPAQQDVRALLPGRVVGQIDASVLRAPQEWSYYQGVSDLPGDAIAATGWGGNFAEFYGEGGVSLAETNPRMLAILLTGAAVLMVPLLLFTAMAGRIGGARRDRRSATLRLLGASTAQLRWVVAAEVTVASVGGLVVAGAAYLAVRALAPLISIAGYGAQTADISPDPTAVALIAVGVPLLAAVSALTGSRRASENPLGDQTRPVDRPALWWRFVLLMMTVATTVFVFRGGARFGADPGGWGTFGLAGIVILDVCCVAAFVGPVTHWVAAWSRGGPAFSLARGRLLRQPGLITRPAAAVSTVLASVIALMSVLSLGFGVDAADGGDQALPFYGRVSNLTMADWQRLEDNLRTVDGVRSVDMTGQLPISADHAQAQVATCDSMRYLTDAGTGCTDGDVFGQIQVSVTAGGDRFTVNGTTSTWSTPADVHNTYVDATGNPDPMNSYQLTPSAVLTQIPALTTIPDVWVGVTMPTDSLPAAREAVAWLGPQSATVLTYTDFSGTSDTYSWARAALLCCAVLVLLISALAQWLLAAEYVTDRRRAFAVARASGVPLATLTRSVLIGALFPVLIGVVLAAGVGVVLAWEIVTTRGDAIVALDLGWLVISCGATLLVSAVVAAGTAVQLRNTTGPSALRTE